MPMNLKKAAAVAAAVLTLVGGTSFSMANAQADDAGSVEAAQTSAPASDTKELLLKTNDSRVQGVQVFDSLAGSWSACIPTPDPDVHTPTGLQVSAGTVAVNAFSKADCYMGELQGSIYVNSSMISNGWIDTAPGFENNTTGQVQVDLYKIIS
jgi:hypothetical protein